MIDQRATIYDHAGNLLVLDASADMIGGLTKYENTPAGCGAAQLTLGLRYEEIFAKGYWTKRNIVEISSGDDALQQAFTTNLLTDSDFSNAANWPDSSGGAITFTASGPGSAQAMVYTGTGSAAGFKFRKSQVVTVVPGTVYPFGAWVDPTAITSGSPQILIMDPTASTQYASLGFGPGVGRTSIARYSSTWTCPAGVTQVIVLWDLENAVIANGGILKFSQPMFEAKSSASAWYVPGGQNRLYVGSRYVYDPANTPDTQQIYLWDNVNLAMRIPVLGVGTDAFSGKDYLTVGSPAAGGGNVTSLSGYNAGTIVGRRRYAGQVAGRARPNIIDRSQSQLRLGALVTRLGECNGTVTLTASTNTDVGAAIYTVLNNAVAAGRWPEFTLAQANFPTVGTIGSGTWDKVGYNRVADDLIGQVTTGDLWILRLAHDRTPRLIKFYTSSSNTYAYNLTLPQGVLSYDPFDVRSDDQDTSQLYNSIEIIGDTDPSTKQPVAAISQDTTGIGNDGQIDATPVTNMACKTVAQCQAYGRALLNQNATAHTNAQFKVMTCGSKTAGPHGLLLGDVADGFHNITITRFDSTGSVVNMVPDSEFNQPQLWSVGGTGVNIIANAAPNGIGAVMRYVGTGAASSYNWQGSPIINVVPGSPMTVSVYVNSGAVTSGTLQLLVMDPTATTTYKALNLPANASQQRVQATFNVPAGVTQIIVLPIDTQNATVPSGVNFDVYDVQVEYGGNPATAYVPNYAAPNVYGLAASIVTTIDAAQGISYQEGKFSAIEPDWNADMAEKANALATAMLKNRLTPVAIDQYCVSSDAFPAPGMSTSGLVVSPPTFLALFGAGSGIKTVTNPSFTLTANATNWVWLNSNLTWTVNTASTPVASAILFAVFTTNATAVLGQQPKAPVGVVKIGVGNINVASNLPAPTYSGTPAVVNVTSPTSLAADVGATVTVTNVPQDGSAAGLAYYYRTNGQSAWIPYGEQNFAGQPNPAATQTMPQFVYGQLQNGVTYDFGVGFMGLAGYGPVTMIKTAFVANSIVITTPYLIGTTSPTPTVSSVTLTNGTSANGVAAAVRLQFTLTNQPTDGSLSRISIWFRKNGDTAWTFYTNLGVPGLPTPTASQAYDITLADLTNGQNYDFAVSFENAQGQDSATFGAIYTNWPAQALNLPTSALPKIPTGTTVAVASVTVNSYGGTSGAAQTANVTFTPTVTPPGGDPRPFSQWGAGYQYWAKVNDSGSSDGDTNVLNYVSAGYYTGTTSGSAITDTFGPLGAGHAWQLAIQPLDQQGNGGPLAIVGLTTSQTIGTPTLADFSTAPTVSTSSVTSARVNKAGAVQSATISFTVSDFGSATPFAKPSALDHIEVAVFHDAAAEPHNYIAVAAASPASFTSSTTTYSKMIPCPLGTSVTVGIRYVGANGKPSAVTMLAACNPLNDPNSDFIDTTDANGGIKHGRSPATIRGSFDSTSGAFLNSPRNLLINAGFDLPVTGSSNVNPPLMANNIPGWVANGSGGSGDASAVSFYYASDTGQYGSEKVGAGRLQMSRPAASPASAWSNIVQRIAVAPGQTLSYRLWWVLQNIKQSHVKIVWYQSNGSAYVTGSGTLSAVNNTSFIVSGTDSAGTTPWTIVQGSLTVPSDAAYGDVEILCGWSYDATNPAYTYVDNFMLAVSQKPMAFADSAVSDYHLPPSHQNNFDTGGSLKKSTTFNVQIPNSLPNLSSDIALAANGGSSGSTTISIWMVSASGHSNNPNGGQYPAWMYPDGSGGINPTPTNCGSSSVPLHTFPGLTTGAAYYFVIGYNLTTGQFTNYTTIYTSAPTQEQIASVLGDGNVVAVVATANSGSSVTAGGGTHTVSGGGGRQVNN